MSLNSKTNINISSSKWSRSYFEGLPLPLDFKVPGYVIFIFASIARFKPPTSCQPRYPGMQPERPHYWQYGLLSKPKKPPQSLLNVMGHCTLYFHLSLQIQTEHLSQRSLQLLHWPSTMRPLRICCWYLTFLMLLLNHPRIWLDSNQLSMKLCLSSP